MEWKVGKVCEILFDNGVKEITVNPTDRKLTKRDKTDIGFSKTPINDRRK